ncbi:reverse transcriptase domain-containing protein [Tanacetum coccineum]
MDQEKTTFTCPFRTYAYRRMPFGLSNAPATFQRCMLVIFHDMIEESVEVFMNDFSVFGNSFDNCLNNLDKMLQRTENVAADYLSRIDNDETSDDSDVDDNFSGETLMEITTKDTPWFADFANYLVVKDNPAVWSRKLDDVLWAFRTGYKTPTGTTPYKLLYGKNCHLPFEIEHRAYRALKNCNPDLIAAGGKRMFQLHELDEI